MHEEPQSEKRFITIGDGSGLEREDRFHRQELQLAFRNRGMPLEGLRYPITPTGMHYLLIHFDIPDVDVNTWRLEVQGLVARPLSLALKDVQSRPAVTIPVTMECAGNGRALLSPRSIGQPWLVEAIGTAEWTGIPRGRRPVHRARSRRPGGRGAGVSAKPQPRRGDARRGAPRLRDERCAAAAAARIPAAPARARMVRHGEREVAHP